MRAYWELAKGGYRRYARYRTAIAASLIANGAFGFIRASLLMTAITTAGTAVGGYDLQQASTYVWIGQGLLGAIPLWGVTEIAQRVKSGEIAMDFLRPVAALGQWWAADLGRAASQVIPRLVPMLAVGALTTGLALPRHPLPYLLFAVSLVLAVSLTFLAWTLVNLLAMWVVEIRGYHALRDRDEPAHRPPGARVVVPRLAEDPGRRHSVPVDVPDAERRGDGSRRARGHRHPGGVVGRPPRPACSAGPSPCGRAS